MREVIETYRKIGGFQALQVVKAYEVLREALGAEVRFFSFTGNLVATGLREIIAEVVRKRLFNVLITTAGALDHDIAKAMGAHYLPASFDVDDEELARSGFHRLGNVLIKRDDYGPLVEKFVLSRCESLWGKSLGTFQLTEEFGRDLPEDSILGAAARYGVKIFVPGVVDGAVGTALLTCNDLARVRNKPKFIIDVLRDEEELRELVHGGGRLAALIVGGGISKHHVIWWAQFIGGLDYAVYVTTAVEYDGSLSGARPREAVSWGKIKPGARVAHVYADASLVLPLLLGAL